MSKFYVVCGSQSLVMNAPTAEHAAMRLLDEVMAAHVWIYDDADLTDQDRRDHLVLEALLHLGSSVDVSERGLGHSEAGRFEVPELLEQWHRLMTGISRLFIAAGLAPRRVLPELIGSSAAPHYPR
ncbi:MAG: hypothetical protein ACO1RT_03135 [Planctomycetaceae bacterium]